MGVVIDDRVLPGGVALVGVGSLHQFLTWVYVRSQYGSRKPTRTTDVSSDKRASRLSPVIKGNVVNSMESVNLSQPRQRAIRSKQTPEFPPNIALECLGLP